MSTAQTNTGTTTVQQVDVDDALSFLDMPTVITQTPEDKKPNMFSPKGGDTSFLDNPNSDEEAEEKDDDAGADGTKLPDAAAQAAAVAALNDDDNLSEEEKAELEKNKVKPSKQVMLTVVNKLIEKGTLVPFDDGKKLEEYTAADLEDLIEANFEERDRKMRETTPLEFFDSLPRELQYAAKYVADGGKNLKQLFQSLAHAEEAKTYDPKTPEGQVQIVRSFLANTTKFTSEEIEEEINGWKDRDELEAKANKFKPKLDAMQEEVIANTLKTQEENRKKQIEQSNKYKESVYNVLLPGELNGIKLDKKTQGTLFAGLVQANYASMSGRNTNLLGHLLEQHQFVKPNHALIAEALWLLQDPEGYREKVKEVAKKDTVTATVKKLKTEESNRNGSGTNTDTDDDQPNKNAGAKPGLKRPVRNIFSRE